jgi:glutamate dehydrogenase (NADP+)
MLELRASNKDAVEDYAHKFNVPFYEGKRPWEVKMNVALPCATENEIQKEDAEALVKNGAKIVCEGANMPTTLDAYHVFKDSDILYAPGKASNAGGVATSGLEMSQNSMRLPWSREEVDNRLKEIMKRIHGTCVETADRFGTPGNYVNGANIAGFLKVADAMLDQGLV